MDLCTLNLNNRNLGLFAAKISPFPQRNLCLETPFSCDSGKIGRFKNGQRKVSEIRVLKFRCSSYKPIVVRAMNKKNDENSSSSGDVLIFFSFLWKFYLGFWGLALLGIFLVFGVELVLGLVGS